MSEKIHFDLKTGYIVVEDNQSDSIKYTVEKVEYFTLNREPSLFNMFKPFVNYYRKSSLDDWQIEFQNYIYKSKRLADAEATRRLRRSENSKIEDKIRNR